MIGRAGLVPELQGTSASRPSPKLVAAAHEFEAQLMKELLQPLQSGGGLGGEEDEGSAGALGEFASEALGQALSRSGGFGIADRLIAQVSHSGKTAGTSVAGRTHGNSK